MDLQLVSPEEIASREVELGCDGWTSFRASSCSAVNSGATDIVVVTLPKHGRS